MITTILNSGSFPPQGALMPSNALQHHAVGPSTVRQGRRA